MPRAWLRHQGEPAAQLCRRRHRLRALRPGRALSGIRVLDLTRILAGPMAARTLTWPRHARATRACAALCLARALSQPGRAEHRVRRPAAGTAPIAAGTEGPLGAVQAQAWTRPQASARRLYAWSAVPGAMGCSPHHPLAT